MTDPSEIHDRPRELRSNTTLPERILWQRLRNRRLGNMKFRRQHPIGPFIVDFCCIAKQLVIEVDGVQHENRQREDADRTKYLEENGYRVVRFRNFEVFDEIEGVLDKIAAAAAISCSE
jgi:very-short-patch-repair endonuclease